MLHHIVDWTRSRSVRTHIHAITFWPNSHVTLKQAFTVIMSSSPLTVVWFVYVRLAESGQTVGASWSCSLLHPPSVHLRPSGVPVRLVVERDLVFVGPMDGAHLDSGSPARLSTLRLLCYSAAHLKGGQCSRAGPRLSARHRSLSKPRTSTR